jgi:hypothetical protein
MAISKIRARRGSIKLLDLIGAKYDERTMPSIPVLESLGFCVTLGDTVLPIAAHEVICDLLGGVPV